MLGVSRQPCFKLCVRLSRAYHQNKYWVELNGVWAIFLAESHVGLFAFLLSLLGQQITRLFQVSASQLIKAGRAIHKANKMLMMGISHEEACHITGLLCAKLPALYLHHTLCGEVTRLAASPHRLTVMQSFDIFFDVLSNKYEISR